jgi:hypothetical protein
VHVRRQVELDEVVLLDAVLVRLGVRLRVRARGSAWDWG